METHLAPGLKSIFYCKDDFVNPTTSAESVQKGGQKLSARGQEDEEWKVLPQQKFTVFAASLLSYISDDLVSAPRTSLRPTPLV